MKTFRYPRPLPREFDWIFKKTDLTTRKIVSDHLKAVKIRNKQWIKCGVLRDRIKTLANLAKDWKSGDE